MCRKCDIIIIIIIVIIFIIIASFNLGARMLGKFSPFGLSVASRAVADWLGMIRVSRAAGLIASPCFL